MVLFIVNKNKSVYIYIINAFLYNMARTQKYGISFPTQAKEGKFLLDLNKSMADNVKSQLVHLIFTPEGQRLRNPQFGTTLIQYLFNPDDEYTWEDVVMHVKEKVNRFIVGCNVEDITAEQADDRHVNVKIKYSVTERDGSEGYYELNQTI